MHNRRNRMIAIAGMFQAASLVQQLAWAGKFEQYNATPLIESLFALEAKLITDIYKDLTTLQHGLEAFIRIFEINNRQTKDQEIARYCLSLMYVERCLLKRKDLLDILKKGIIRAQKQTTIFPLMHDNIMANLASIYTDTLSTLSFRVHITGEQNYLTNINNTNKIRTLLLAGVRAAVLWRQMGGNRWQLFFCRKQVINDANLLFTEIQNGNM